MLVRATANPTLISESPRFGRYHSLDAWRGVACLAIVIYHSLFYIPLFRAVELNQLYSPGPDESRLTHWAQCLLHKLSIGVPMFFVISGYCIMCAIDLQKTHGSVATYFWRRFRRIYPPYWIAVALTIAAIPCLSAVGFPQAYADDPQPDAISGWQWLGNMTLTESWRSMVIGDRQEYYLLPAWTLCYEEQFYLVCGLMLLFARRHLFRAAAVVSCLAVLARLTFAYLGIDISGFFFDGRWLQFAAGMVLYYRINYASPGQSRWIHGIGIALTIGGLAAWRSVPFVEKSTVISLGFALICSLLHRWDRPLAGSAILAPLMTCGKWCYSMYLVHWPLTRGISKLMEITGHTGVWENLLITVPLALISTLLAAYLFHEHVERQFLNRPSPPDCTPRTARIYSVT